MADLPGASVTKSLPNCLQIREARRRDSFATLDNLTECYTTSCNIVLFIRFKLYCLFLY